MRSFFLACYLSQLPSFPTAATASTVLTPWLLQEVDDAAAKAWLREVNIVLHRHKDAVKENRAEFEGKLGNAQVKLSAHTSIAKKRNVKDDDAKLTAMHNEVTKLQARVTHAVRVDQQMAFAAGIIASQIDAFHRVSLETNAKQVPPLASLTWCALTLAGGAQIWYAIEPLTSTSRPQERRMYVPGFGGLRRL